jgi:uncharacterized SAM-dependent methyltransferase
MKYFKTEELADKYRISERTIQRWIQLSKTNQIELELIDIGKRSFILDTPSNHLIIQDLLNTNLKFKNKLGLRSIQPQKEFYEIFNESQIIDIITNLEIHKELPHKYCYFNGGAAFWDKYVHRVLNENQPITIKSTIQLLGFEQDYILSLVKDFGSINVIDIGPGNGVPVKNFLDFLISKKLLRKYIGIDYSPEVLKITEKNLKAWFGNDFPFEGHLRDVTSDSFQELLFKNTHHPDIEEAHSANVVMFLGSTIENQRQYDKSLSNVISSIGKQDIFILGQLLDTERSRIHINFKPKDKSSQANGDDLERLIRELLELLNIKEEYYELERLYSEKERARIIRIKLNRDIDLKIQTDNFQKHLIIPNNDHIVIWRHNHHTGIEVINKMNHIGFDILRSTKSLDEQQILITSKIKPPLE